MCLDLGHTHAHTHMQIRTYGMKDFDALLNILPKVLLLILLDVVGLKEAAELIQKPLECVLMGLQ